MHDTAERCHEALEDRLDCEMVYLEEKELELIESLGDTEHGFFLA